MRSTVGLAVCGIVVVVLVGRAGEKPPENHVKLMKEAGAAGQSLRQSVEAKQYDRIAATAASAKTTFMAVEAFWSARKAEDAVTFARTAVKAATDLDAAAAAKNDEGIAAASRALNATCGGCHTAHRERLPDGSYEMK